MVWIGRRSRVAVATVSFAIAWQVGCGSQAQHEPSDAELIKQSDGQVGYRVAMDTAWRDEVNDSRWSVPFEREWPYDTSPKRQACDSDGTHCDGGDDSVKDIYILVQQLLDANTPAHLTSSVTSLDPILVWTDIGNTANLFWPRPHRSPPRAAERRPRSGWW